MWGPSEGNDRKKEQKGQMCVVTKMAFGMSSKLDGGFLTDIISLKNSLWLLFKELRTVAKGWSLEGGCGDESRQEVGEEEPHSMALGMRTTSRDTPPPHFKVTVPFF